MKPIELKLKMYSMTWLSPVLLIFTMFFAIAMVNPINAAQPNLCDTFCDQDGDHWIRDHNRCTDCVGNGIDCDDNDSSVHEDCSGGSDGGYIQHNFSNAVIWGNVVYGLPYETDQGDSQSTRNCGPGSVDPVIPPNPDVDIKYVCHSDADFLYGRDSWNTVYLDFSDLWVGEEPGELNPSGRDTSLCDRLVNPDNPYFPMEIVPKKEVDCQNPPDRYCEVDPMNVGRLSMYYFVLDESNDEPCTWDSNRDNSCKVRIFTQGYFYNECNERGTKCGRRIGLVAYGHVKPALRPADGEPTEINPFTQDQSIVIEELNGFFMGIGTNRSEANCYFNNVSGEDGDGNPTFHNANLVLKTCVDLNENGVCDNDLSE